MFLINCFWSEVGQCEINNNKYSFFIFTLYFSIENSSNLSNVNKKWNRKIRKKLNITMNCNKMVGSIWLLSTMKLWYCIFGVITVSCVSVFVVCVCLCETEQQKWDNLERGRVAGVKYKDTSTPFTSHIHHTTRIHFTVHGRTILIKGHYHFRFRFPTKQQIIFSTTTQLLFLLRDHIHATSFIFKLIMQKSKKSIVIPK